MARGRWNGGIIGPNLKVTTSSASGIFSLSEAQVDVSAGLIPSVPVPVIAEPQFNLTTLLLHGDSGNGNQNNTFLDESTNALTITRGGTATQGSFSPFSQTGWSNYFNGSTDYFTSSSISSLNFGSNSFTIEFWMWGIAGTLAPIIHQATYNSTGWSIWRYDNSGNATTTKLCFMLNGATFILVTATGFTANAWTHVAISKTGTNAYIFINGISQGTSSSAPSTVTASSSPFQVWYIDSSSWNFTGYMDAGYISNLRILNGTALYTSNFTPSTAPLTAITNTQLLTCQSNRFKDNSTNALALTTAGTPSVQAFSPFAPADAYGVSSVGGSTYYSGSTDSLLTPPTGTNTAFTCTGNFTVEGWYYPTSVTGNHYLFTLGSETTGRYTWYLAGANITSNLYGSGSVTYTGTAASIPINAWTHIAVVRSSSTVSLYVNGVASATTDTQAGTLGNGVLRVASDSSGTNVFAGYISNFRIVNGGTQPYTGNFTPPTVPVTAIANTSFLLNGTNAGVYDATAKNDIITYGTAQISTAQTKFGGSSLYFDGTSGGYMTTTGTNQTLIFGTGPFTIEHWVYFSGGTVGGDNNTIGDISSFTTSGNWLFMWNYVAAGKLSFWINNAVVCSTSNAYNDGAWHHVAVTRKSDGTVTIWVDGVADGTGSNTASVGTGGIMIGNQTGLSRYWTGYIDDIRITRYARYTSNFTPQTYAFLNQ